MKMSLSKLLITRTNYSFHFESGLISSLEAKCLFFFPHVKTKKCILFLINKAKCLSKLCNMFQIIHF